MQIEGQKVVARNWKKNTGQKRRKGMNFILLDSDAKICFLHLGIIL